MTSKPLARHESLDLSACAEELIAIFQHTTITPKDRATRAYQGCDIIAPMSTEFINHDQYAAEVYLAGAAEDALRLAVVSGALPLWVGDEPAPLDAHVMFAANKWDQRAAIKAGVYRPTNMRTDFGDDARSRYHESVLWARNDDWWRVRGAIVDARAREFESEARFDRLWGVPHAVAWLASRDSNLVNAVPGRFIALQSKDPRFDGWMATWIALADEVSVRFCKCGRRSLDCPALNAAREALRAACERGDVRAYGQRAANTPYELIPQIEFQDAELWHGRGLFLSREVDGKGSRIWNELRFESADVLALTTPRRVRSISSIPARRGVSASQLRSFVRRVHREKGNLPHVTRKLLPLAKAEFAPSDVSRTMLQEAVEAEGLKRPQSRPKKSPA